MKISSLFVELGFKVEGSDLDSLRSFEAVLNKIADAADRAVASLKQLQGIKIKAPSVSAQLAPSAPSAPSAPVPPMFLVPTGGMVPGGGRGAGGGNIPPTSSTAPASPPSFGSQIFTGLQKAFPLLRLAAQIGVVATVVSALAKAAMNAVKAMIGMTDAAIRATKDNEKLRTLTGLSREQIKDFELFATTAGIGVESVTDAVKSIQLEIAKIKMGGGDVFGFSALGIDMRKSADEIFKSFAEKTKYMNAADARMYAERLGVNEDLFFALRKYSDEFGKQVDRRLITTDRENEQVRKTARSLDDLGRVSRLLYDRLATDLSPAIEFSAQVLSKFATAMLRFADMLRGAPDPFNFKEFKDKILSSPKMTPTPSALPNNITAGGMSNSKVEVNNEFNIVESKNPSNTSNLISREMKRGLANAYYQTPAYTLIR